MNELAMETGSGTEVSARNRPYTVAEEIANSIAHGVGALGSLAALILLCLFAADGGGWAIASAIVYGLSLLLEYTASTLYHALPNPTAKHVFKVLDHAGIYVLIAGTYTPFCLITLREAGGPVLLSVIWGAAIAGISVEAFWAYRPRWVSVAIYLLMGWAVVFTLPSLMDNLARGGVALLVAGGVAYTLGTPFYIFKRVPYFHFVWHLFVVAGSVFHLLAVLIYVI